MCVLHLTEELPAVFCQGKYWRRSYNIYLWQGILIGLNKYEVFKFKWRTSSKIAGNSPTETFKLRYVWLRKLNGKLLSDFYPDNTPNTALWF